MGSDLWQTELKQAQANEEGKQGREKLIEPQGGTIFTALNSCLRTEQKQYEEQKRTYNHRNIPSRTVIFF